MRILGFDVRRESPPMGKLYCGICKRLKRDEEFHRNRSKTARRGRDTICRACEKKKARRRSGKPCIVCGGRTRAKNPTKTGMCRKCYFASGKRTEDAIMRDVDKSLVVRRPA